MALPIGLHNNNKWRCYMNAVIQALLTFDEFYETVHRLLRACQDVPTERMSKTLVRQYNLILELYVLLRDLRRSVAHSTEKFYERLQTVHRTFVRGEQQDVQELLVVLCTSITELNQLAGSQLKLPTKFSIVSAIECRGCYNTLQKVEETDWITEVDSDGTYSQRKVLGHLNVPKTIEVSELNIDQPTRRPEEDACYQLESVVVHIGRRMSSGHYVCMRRHASGWLMFNDEEVTERTLDSALGEENNPYLLFYRRLTN